MAIRGGKLNRRIIIQSYTATRDGYGAEVKAWAAITNGNVRAEIKPFVGREYFDQKQINAEVSHRIKIRYLAGITPKMRILYGTRIFDIVSAPIYEERNREINMLCIERI